MGRSGVIGEEGGLAIWLINLPRSVERRGKMDAQLDAMGLDYKRFLAVDGREEWNNLVPMIDLEGFRRNVGREVMPGEIGAYFSHLGVWEEFLDSHYDVALVLEDDVVFHDDFLGALHMAMVYKDDWDFLKLNKIRAKKPVSQGQIGPYSLNAYAGPATGLGAYLIHRELAERLLHTMLPIRRPIDHELDLLHVHDYRHYGLEPFPSHVDDGNQSTITGSNFADVKKWPFYRRLPTLWLRLKNRWARLQYLRKKGRLKPKSR